MMDITIGDMPATYNVLDEAPTLIFVHGSYGFKDGEKNVAASKAILEKEIASTLRYSSSRNWEIWNALEDPTLEQTAKAFKNLYDGCASS